MTERGHDASRRPVTSIGIGVLWGASLLTPGGSAAVRVELSSPERLAAVYDTILDARFEEADRLLRETCPPAPPEACGALAAVSLWWAILIDPDSRALDVRFNAAAASAIAGATAWVRREPERGEAWFYLAGSHAPLVQWRVLRGQQLAAAREGQTVKNALERALARDPTLADAHFGIGLYRYYADVAPAAFTLLRWLFLLPGGDRARGLRDMREARDRGQLLRDEADFQLHYVYLWYEHDTARGLALVRGLEARHPSNPVFLQRIAEIQDEYLRDHAGSAASWQALLDRATAGRTESATVALVRARLGLAEELLHLAEPHRAIDHLERVIAARPAAPHGADARAHLLLGAACARLGQRDRATAAYRTAIARAPANDRQRIAARARAALAIETRR